ncbi:GIY-YIG nuclease family protein [Blastopirellula sp. J2-11]|uniref:GIY-YIG nuclease family protein n=1 Tax=Blastopirellula sp. J2-11 TaxID=2943192 RepID=UPI0021C66F35|nr:GIY-YIG nuclease family protein [Blastopirellula sp. J2-11]UUO04787.1 GIY-YIG nuclease family protein [Blastopirellula sp. J2-11]
MRIDDAEKQDSLMMTSPAAKTIQIFLPSGEPRGVRIAEFTNRTVQVIVVPRSDLVEAKQRAELDHIAVYFLFGESEESAKPIVYIGQTEDIRKRLNNHNSKKDFWTTAVVVSSRTQTFTQAHIRYLEWYCLQAAKETGRFAIANDVQPGMPFVTEPMEADLLDVFETLSVLVSTVGYPVFEPFVNKSTNSETFFIKSIDCAAEGDFVEDGFVVLAGAIARKEITPSGVDLIEPVRKLLIESGVLVDQGTNLKFTQDYLFNSPSRAAIVVLGRRANGWTEWKNSSGRTLDEVYRMNGDDQTSD